MKDKVFGEGFRRDGVGGKKIYCAGKMENNKFIVSCGRKGPRMGLLSTLVDICTIIKKNKKVSE